MKKYLTYAMVADAALVVVEFVAPVSHAVLPLAGTHFSQMSLLLMVGYFGGEVQEASRAPPEG